MKLDFILIIRALENFETSYSGGCDTQISFRLRLYKLLMSNY